MRWVALLECYHRKRMVFKPRLNDATRCDQCRKDRVIIQRFQKRG